MLISGANGVSVLFFFPFDFKWWIPLLLLPKSVSALWIAKRLDGENISVWQWKRRGSACSWTLSVLHGCFRHSLSPSFSFLFFSHSSSILLSFPPTCLLFIPLHLSCRNLPLPVIFSIFQFYLTTLFPILSFSALPLCFRSIPTAASLSHLLSVPSPLIQCELLS